MTPANRSPQGTKDDANREHRFAPPSVSLPKGGGAIKGIEAVSRELAKHFPDAGGGPNELPDAPVVI